MLSDKEKVANLDPVIHPYIDVVHVWLKQRLSPAEVGFLRNECRTPPHVKNKEARFDRSYRQFIILRKPSLEALQALSACEGALINYIEFALDWVFDDEETRYEAFGLVCRFSVKRWHG